MRPATATAAAVTTVIGIGAAAAVAAGRYASDAALKAPPKRPLPSDPKVTVHGTAAGRVTLTRSLASLRPGTYGLKGPGVHAAVGPVAEGAERSADTVVRRLLRVSRGELRPGTRLWLTPEVYAGDPGSALGLEFREVRVPGERGDSPAWFVPGSRGTWVICVHGLGTGRAQTMNLMPFLTERRFPVLAVSYRGDPGAPRPREGLGHLGESEWRDLDAAVAFALRGGARRIILYGWSTGATMALRCAVDSEYRGHISGLVLDSPVLDTRATLRALTAARTPAPLVPLAVRAAQGRTGLAGDPRAALALPARLTVPTLLVHGPADTVAPWSASRALARQKDRLISLHTVPDAPHAAMWNADPEKYEEALRRFITPLM
ncbi:alpha/beta hydrolase [Streptomyces fuscigenes]|uniref:alpha/beta hydrolase n=1 Tax=Streptomyces fuscigenes TaxID=1528880 RepID=UPI001F1A8B90|nr:alpha/beta fold hydrolase [Streptomyces fuscigenes]MCF3964173.1 alpha/beta hydrolase [Streptomyces fuscigenes]